MLVVDYTVAMLDRKVVSSETEKDRKSLWRLRSHCGDRGDFRRRRRYPMERRNESGDSDVVEK